MDNPNIVRYLSQKCIQERPNVSVIECIGEDAQGRKWKFYVDNVWFSSGHEEHIISQPSPPYNFRRISS